MADHLHRVPTGAPQPARTPAPAVLPARGGTPRPTVAIVGVGAIGTVIAHALTAASDVLLCRRGSDAAITITIAGATTAVEAAVASSPLGLVPVDWVVIATKAQDTAATGPWLDALVGPDTRIAVLQNGIGHADRVDDWAPEARVLPGIVYIAAEKTGANHVVCRADAGIALAATPNSAAFAALFGDRLQVRLVDDFITESWTKIVMNSALNTMTALTDRTMEVTGDAGIRPLLRCLLVEGVAVARAAGARFTDASADAFLARMDQLPRDSATSMLLDRRAGRPLEHHYLTGAVLAEAEARGIPAPNLRMVHGLINAVSAPTVTRGLAASARELAA